jgi:hypothetical protein
MTKNRFIRMDGLIISNKGMIETRSIRIGKCQNSCLTLFSDFKQNKHTVMDNPLEKIEETFELDLPTSKAPTLDSHLDQILPEMFRLSEDLRETEHYVSPGGKPWLEVKDDSGFQEWVLHFFNENGEYLQSVDGNITKGHWRLLDGTNKMIIEQGSEKHPVRSELFELAFLNANFFILKKHGNQLLKGRHKYFAMGYEPYIRNIKWRDYVELLYNERRNQFGLFQVLLIVLVLIVVAFIFYSLR